jgi:hypothetical protein
MEPINGGVYKKGYRRFVLIYLSGTDKWGMLHIERHTNKGMSCPMFQHDATGEYSFTKEELCTHWKFDEWQLLDGRLRIEKIDGVSFTEYTRGDLEEVL